MMRSSAKERNRRKNNSTQMKVDDVAQNLNIIILKRRI